MSSLDHPTANLEDVFSSNFPNYVPPVSPNYVPASPGKTYSSASNLFGIAPPTLSLFPDDPYMNKNTCQILTMKRISDKRTKNIAKNGQNQARNGKAWKSQSQIEAKDQMVNCKKSTVKVKPTSKNT
ncbi:hypothetical protein Tco_1332236 [Tanacetum coccineum]